MRERPSPARRLDATALPRRAALLTSPARHQLIASEATMRLLRLLLSLAIAGLVAAPLAAQPQQKAKIRAGWVSTPASLIPLIFAKPGLAKHRDKSYSFEPIYYAASPLQITALANDELDIAALGYSSLPLAVQNAGLADLRILADEIQDGVPGHYATPYWVRKDSGIARIEDLKGKVVATNGLGSGVDIVMRSALRRHGLTDNRDYTVIEAPFPTQKAVLKDRKADLIVTALPFSYDPDLREMANILFDSRREFGAVALSFWVARQSFIAKNRAALVDLLEDYVTALRWYLEPANHREAAEIVAGFLKRPAASFEGWLFTEKDFYRDRNGIPNLKALQDNIDKTRELGFIKEPLAVAKFADLSLVEEAGQRRR
jgi:NitT/TauT family transport system substrate-binding protein